MSDDDKIKPIGVKFKQPPGEDEPKFRVLDRFDGGCSHNTYYRDGKMREVQYLIRPGEAEVECGQCGAKLDPMWVLNRIASRESEALRLRKIAAQEMARLHERSRTKCRHCGQMTEISRR